MVEERDYADPQARAKFQMTDWLAIRGGVGTTFRGPPSQSLAGNLTSLQIIGSSFRAIDINGNPNLGWVSGGIEQFSGRAGRKRWDTVGDIIARGLLCRCPNCGKRGLLASWFRLGKACRSCGMELARSAGIFKLGIFVLIIYLVLLGAVLWGCYTILIGGLKAAHVTASRVDTGRLSSFEIDQAVREAVEKEAA